MSTPPHEPPWPSVERLFLAALDLDSAERVRMLAAEPDPSVRDAAASLLAALDSSDGFLDGLGQRPVTALLLDDDALAGTTPAPLPGDRIGAWRLVREAGRGGMGVVWLSERADGAFTQQVALKLLPPGPGGSLGPRLVRERQALARLQHPAIARLIDGGETADGQPFYAMEYIDGLPLTAWADRHRLTVRARVELFAEAVAAVRHAHRHLVVHRDLKPSNVFVAAGEDGKPQVKLLDFGLARLLDPDAAPDDLENDDGGAYADLLTRPGARAMTPEYAAPEQVRGEGVTTATDVYALGIVLYELLTGRRPYSFTDRSAAGITRVVETVAPEPPSLVVARPLSDGTPPETVAEARATRPGGLQRQIGADLDAVVARALQKDPAARYPSAEALAEDLARWLDGRPLAARTGQGGAGEAAYRMGRFVRRHRLGVGAAVLLVAALAAGIVGTLVQSRATAREAARAGAARDFLLAMFDPADPNISSPDSVTARQLLAMAADRADDELADQPGLRVDLLCQLGDMTFRADTPEHAVEIYRQADGIERDLPPTAVKNVACGLVGLGEALQYTGDMDGAEAAIREALARQRRVLGPEDQEVATTEATLGQALIKQDELDEAEPLLVHALAVHRATYGPDDADNTSFTTEVLARLRFMQGRTDETATLLAEVLRIRRLVYGDEHLDVATARANLAMVLNRLGRLREAERLQRATLARYQERLGPEHPFTWSAGLNLADVLLAEGRPAAVDTVLQALRGTPGDSATVANRLTRLSAAALGQGHVDVAADYAAQALRYADNTSVLTAQAAVQRARRQCAAVPALLAHALEKVDEPSQYTLPAVIVVAGCRLDAGDAAGAAALLQRVHDGAAEDATIPTVPKAEVDEALGRALIAARRPAAARAPLTAALSVYERSLGRTAARTAEVRRLLAEVRRPA